jgi:AcrR family transcriptional regulator
VSGLRERKKQQTRDALVDSAFEQFAAKGFEQVTIEDIVAACDVSPRTFFRYFAAKEDVLFADADEKRVSLVEVLERQPEDVPPMRALRAALLELADEYQDQRRRVQLRHQLIRSTPSLRGRAAERTHTWEGTITAEMRATGRAGKMSDFDLKLMVASAVTALRVSTEQWISDPKSGDLKKLLDAALDQLCHGLEP